MYSILAHIHKLLCVPYIYIAGTSDVHCGPYLIEFEAEVVSSSVNILIVNDEQYECDETFMAHINIGKDEGFRRGLRSSTEITIKDDDGNRKYYTLDTALC